MHDRKAPLFSHNPDGKVGADAALMAPRARRPAGVEHKLVLPAARAERLPANPLSANEDPVVVYCGDAQRVSEGFAIALRAMGVQAHIGLPTTNQNREDN